MNNQQAIAIIKAEISRVVMRRQLAARENDKFSLGFWRHKEALLRAQLRHLGAV